jgi:hypothetical protein
VLSKLKIGETIITAGSLEDVIEKALKAVRFAEACMFEVTYKLGDRVHEPITEHESRQLTELETRLEKAINYIKKGTF